MKTPMQRLRELVRLLKNGDNLIPYERFLDRGFFIENLWQPKSLKVMMLMNDPTTSNKLIYLDDADLDDDEILMIVEDLEKML